MLFSSVIFLFLFLPLLCIICFLTKQKYHNIILLLASIIFYAFGEADFLNILLLSVLVNWAGAILIEKFSSDLTLKKLLLVSVILLNIGNLVYFKYFNFIVRNINQIFGGHINFIEVILPLGISFYTFQALSYVIDVYRGHVKAEKNLLKTALFISFFPQLIAGPIIKYHDIEKQIDERTLDFEKVSLGVKRFIIGLSKKVLLANSMGLIADKIFIQNPDSFSHLTAWLGALAYSLQIFFDFSGYSDMAIGLGLIFGFKFLENFNYPYISKSITEFWRRWHISLSTWFKEYVYIPLGGNRQGKLKQIRNLGFVFLLTGIWHGAAWTFVIWGIWNGFFIIFEKIFGLDKESDNVFVKIFQHLYCILVFVIGWVIFRSDNISYAISYVKNMFGLLKVNQSDILYTLPYYINGFDWIILSVAIICSVPLFKNMLYTENKKLKTVVNVWLFLLFIFSASAISSGLYNPFIYFRF